jgi:Kef-type K+ transport system membrane component KefB
MSEETVSVRAADTRPLTARKLLAGYAIVLAFLVIAVAVSLALGHREEAQPSVAGSYSSSSACVESFDLEQSGQYVDLDGRNPVEGKLTLDGGRLKGDVTCGDGTTAALDLAVTGPPPATYTGTLAGRPFEAKFTAAPPAPGASTKPVEKRSGEETFGRLMLAIAAVILAARLLGTALGKIGQPRVMGEVLAGILLGPTLLGAIAPDVQDYLFPPDIIPLLSGAAQIGLAFYLFLVGMELDPGLLRVNAARAAFVSNTSVAFPMALGLLVAPPIYRLLGPDKDYLPFALFMGVSMSITAFPVLARILVERRMLKRPVGALAMASAAIDDVTAWTLLAFATAVASAGSGLEAVRVIGLATAFSIGLFLLVRPLLARVAVAYDEVGYVPQLWIGTIFVGVLLAAFLSQQIGIAAIFGSFLMGLIMPRHAGLTGDVARRLEDFVTTVLLPLFFVVTGLRTEIGSLNRWELWLICLVLIVVAIAGKWLGAMGAARWTGIRWRHSAAFGALMNTRGLTELIVLNIGLDLGLISRSLFTILVLMALVTTFMAGPALRLLDPKEELAAPPEEEFRAARLSTPMPATIVPQRSIIVAPQDDKSIDALLALAEPLARSEPPRELILARLIPPSALATGLAPDNRKIEQAISALNQRRDYLIEHGVQSRAAAFTSPDPGSDLVRLSSEQDVDLVILNGRRPLIGEGVPRGDVGEVLEKASCDVAVLVEREGIPTIDAGHPVYVPFGGADHDWAALELAAWIASVREAPLKLLGASRDGSDGTTGGEHRDASRLIANASLVVQQLAGIPAEPVLVEPGPQVVEAARDAGLLVVGVSERWREEGLGPVRSAIAKSAAAPTLFVRRGERAGALAPKDNMTRFRWSSAGPPLKAR